jgi:hypothetical protein
MILTFPGFSSRSPSLPPPPPPLPTPEDPAVKRRGEEVRLAAQRRRGLASTVKTAGLGDVSDAETARKRLLGS